MVLPVPQSQKDNTAQFLRQMRACCHRYSKDVASLLHCVDKLVMHIETQIRQVAVTQKGVHDSKPKNTKLLSDFRDQKAAC